MKQSINKTKIERRMRQKKDTELVRTIMQLKKQNPEFAKELAKPKRRWVAINLKELDHIDGDVVIAGKVLSAGDLQSKKRVVAWSFSEKAMQKIKDASGEAILLTDELKKNPKLNGLAIVR